ncbi:hypothetical protein C8R48DRAFT_763986 [Suillus tomentosus]|nr:hypothetical protein C8R48DRAFT_763986 [Suillus tomentosus]
MTSSRKLASELDVPASSILRVLSSGPFISAILLRSKPALAGNNTDCVLPYLGKMRNINSIVLLTNGISFAIQAVLLLMIEAWADYGTQRCGVIPLNFVCIEVDIEDCTPNITVVVMPVAVGVIYLAWSVLRSNVLNLAVAVVHIQVGGSLLRTWSEPIKQPWPSFRIPIASDEFQTRHESTARVQA